MAFSLSIFISGCIFHPLRGLKQKISWIKNVIREMHLSPLTGIETDISIPISFRSLMHLSPLTGIETVSDFFTYIRECRCIFHPLRGLKLPGVSRSIFSCQMHLSPLTGIKNIFVYAHSIGFEKTVKNTPF